MHLVIMSAAMPTADVSYPGRQHAKLLVDTRGRYPKPASNIVKA